MELNHRLNSQIKQLTPQDRIKLIGLIAFEFDIYPEETSTDGILPKISEQEYIASMEQYGAE